MSASAGAVLRRVTDSAGALIALLVTAPIFAAIALLVVWDDGRPIFFRQVRMGRCGRPFKIWKFRTMRLGAEGPAITASGDPRVTSAGAWLRAFKLDELPQLFNVVTGDMSLIGPRPEVPQYVQLDDPLWREVLRVKPGITDLATLMHRNEEKILGGLEDPNGFYRQRILPEKLRLNVEYLHSRSLWRDLKLIFLTVRYSFFPEGFDAGYVSRAVGVGGEIDE